MDEALSNVPTSTNDPLDDKIAISSELERPAVIVDHFAPQTAGESLAWIDDLGTRAERYALTLPEIRKIATDLAWIARMNGQRYPGEVEWNLARSFSGSRMKRLVLAYVNGQRLRFDYKFTQLRTQCNKWLAEFSNDSLILGLAAFAALGSRASNGMDLYRRALEAPDADDKTRQVCLAGIAFADNIPEQGDSLLRLSDDMMARGELNENVCYRRAIALRKLGRYDEALTEIDLAIDMLNASGHTLVHEQYSQERRAIISAQDMHLQAEHMVAELREKLSARMDEQIEAASAKLEEKINEATARLDERVDSAQELVSDGLLKMVEILGLFVTLLGFVVGTGEVVIRARTFGERAIAMGLVVVGSLVFFILLRMVTSFRRERRPAR